MSPLDGKINRLALFGLAHKGGDLVPMGLGGRTRLRNRGAENRLY